MIDILLTIVAFNVIIIIFKFFDKLGIDNLQALVINYFVAGLCSSYTIDQKKSIIEVFNSPWIIHAIVIGILFIVTFKLYASSIQKVGIALTTMVNRLSLFIPVSFALVFYPNEQFSFVKVIGLTLALIGIYLSSTRNKKLAFNKKYLGLMLFVFIGQGIADTLFNNAQQRLVDDEDSGLFFMCLLFTAGISGIFILLAKMIKQRPKLALKNGLGGVVLGIANLASIFFFFNALESSGLPSSQVFPVINMGVIVFSAVLGLFLFKEVLTLKNWIGLGFSILAIFVITFIQ